MLYQYHAEECNERRGPSPQLSARATQLQQTSQRWRAVGDAVSDLTDPRLEPCTYRAIVMSLTTTLTAWFHIVIHTYNVNNVL